MGGALNRIILFIVTALMEAKQHGYCCRTTAGACAALPGAVIAMAESMGKDEEEMAKAMLAACLMAFLSPTR